MFRPVQYAGRGNLSHQMNVDVDDELPSKSHLDARDWYRSYDLQ